MDDHTFSFLARTLTTLPTPHLMAARQVQACLNISLKLPPDSTAGKMVGPEITGRWSWVLAYLGCSSHPLPG